MKEVLGTLERGSRWRLWSALGVAAFAPLLWACDDPLPGTLGELNQGSFTYVCLNNVDVGCTDPYDEDPIPSAIAVGSSFDLLFHGDQSARIESGAPGMVEGEDGAFIARKPGKAAMIARSTENGPVLDIVHVPLEQPGGIRLVGDGAMGEIDLETNVTWEWSAIPTRQNGEDIAGSPLCKWTSDDDSVVRVGLKDARWKNTVTGVAPGRANVTVTLGNASHVVAVTVK